MKRTIKVGASFSGKVSTGSFENMNPGFYAEEVFEVDFDGAAQVDAIIEERSKELHDILYKQFQCVAEKATIERIEKEYKNIRLYPRNGKKYPSVTSILNFDGPGFFCSDDELEQYGSRGTITHLRVEHFIKTGVWCAPKDIEACWSDLYLLKKGSLALDADCADFPGFLAKYPITNMENGQTVFNDEFEYAGTPDFIGEPQFSEAAPVKTLFDVKTTVIKIKNLMQCAAYAKPLNIQQIGIVPLNDDTKQKFSKPIMSKDVEGYFEMFLNKRKKFRERYGI